MDTISREKEQLYSTRSMRNRNRQIAGSVVNQPTATYRIRIANRRTESKKKHLQPLTPAALYARVSSDRQDVDLSVFAQLRAFKEYAKANGYSVEHRQRGLAFGVAVGLGQLDVDDQAVAVLGQQTAQIAEPGVLLGTFAVEARASGSVVDSCVTRRLFAARPVALVRGPGLPQRAVGGEVVGREQPAAAHLSHNLILAGGSDCLCLKSYRSIPVFAVPQEVQSHGTFLRRWVS